VGFDLAAWSLTAACWKDLVEQPVSCMQLITYLIVGVALLVTISTFLVSSSGRAKPILE
jgi:hypothetical protein